MSETPKKNNILTYAKRALYLLVFSGIAWFVSYSIEQYNEQDGENIFICDETECFQTVHIHADIAFDLCGETVDLPRETGPLDGLHTHKEKNYLHFHDRVEVDRTILEETGEKERLDEKSLRIQEVIDVFELAPVTYCGTEDIEIIVKVNDAVLDDGLAYNRRDDDDIVLTYTKN